MPTIFGTSRAIVVGHGTSFQPPVKPVGCDCSITDTFNRTVAGGWGTSTSTFPWRLYNTITSASVSPGSAFVSATTNLGGGFTAQLDFDDQADINVLLTGVVLGLPASVPTGNYVDVEFNLFVTNTNVMVSQQPTQTLLSIGFPTGGGGSSTNFVTMPVSTSSPFNMRMVRTGTAFTVRVWPTSGAEPGTWNLTSVSSGTINAFAFSSTTFVSPAPTVSVTVASVDISNVNRCTEFRFDNFDRTVASGWGTSDIGLVWTDSQTGLGGALSVDGVEGVCNFDTTDNASTEHLGVTGLTQMPDNASWTMTTRFQFDYVPVGTTPDYWMRLTFFPGNFPRCTVTISQSALYGGIEDFDSAGPFSITSWTINAWYILELSYDTTTDLLSSRIYLDGTTPPAYQQVSSAPCGHPTGNTSLGLDLYYNSSLNPASRPAEDLFFDWMNFVYPNKPCYQGGPIP